jgi:hypothetical protein
MKIRKQIGFRVVFKIDSDPAGQLMERAAYVEPDSPF